MAILLLLIATLIAHVSTQTLPSCSSRVYCQGELLDRVQMAQPFNDSKTFVDMRMKYDENTTLQNFDNFLKDTNNNPTQNDIKQFISDNFEDGDELADWVPPDYTESPKILSRIQDAQIRTFAQELVKIWLQLAKKIKQEVLDAPEYFSILPVENGFIIPGGRFREFYYWDSYWIIKGLLLCEMYDTVRGMLDNFLSIVEKYGFLPNGARIYYLNRSQPPLLNLMVWEYIKATKDTKWLKKNIHTLDKELRFWLKNRTVEVTKGKVKYTLVHYDSESGSPRPESYYEDVVTASSLTSEEDKIQLYADLKSGAESGWDFSSRWIVDKKGGVDGNLTSLQTRRIIPVDLNSFVCQAFRKLSELYVKVYNYEKALFWLEKANTLQKTIQKVLYNEEDGIWYDWDNELNQQRKFFYPSNFAPLWSEAYPPQDAKILGQRAAKYFENQKINDFQGGIPASLDRTGEQWDLPNAWPPLQSIVILGFYKTGNSKAKAIAKEFADRWVNANMIGFNNTKQMFEKYDAENPGQYGGGGEYTVQSGFGWTNGVLFELFDLFYATPTKK